MTFKTFLQNLLPSFKRDRLEDDSRNIRNQLTTIVLPTYATTVRELKAPLKSPEGIDFTRIYSNMTGFKGPQSILFDIENRLLALPKLLDAIDKELSEEFTSDIAAAGLTLRKANVVRALDVLGFISKYSMSFINAVVHYEIAERGLVADYVSDVTPGEHKRLLKFLPDFAQFLKSLTDSKDYLTVFNNIPEARADDETFSNVVGARTADPLQLFAASGFRGNPIYTILMVYADFQMNSYKQMQEQKKLLEIRLLQLKRVEEQRPSPELERQVKVLSSRVASLAEAIRKKEESFA